MSDYTPTTEQALGDEIARVRHGQNVTASDLANRLMPWLAKLKADVWDDGAEMGHRLYDEPMHVIEARNPHRNAQ